MPLSSSDHDRGLDKHVAHGQCLWHFDTTCKNFLEVVSHCPCWDHELQVVSVVDDITKSQQDLLCSVLEGANS